MTKSAFTILTVVAVLILEGCHKENGSVQEPGNGSFIDCGAIPAQVSAHRAEFQTAVYNDNCVFVATSDGIWKNNLSSKEWSRSGLEGKCITAIYKHPSIADKFFAGVMSDYSPSMKTIYISTDGGTTWNESNSPVFDDYEDHYENYLCFAVRPGHPEHIYANLEGGTMIAVSTDGGLTWARRNYDKESYAGDQSNITFIPGNDKILYQGSESPLDDAWLGKYDINISDPVFLENFSRIVGIDTWSNRRPDELQTNSYTGNNIYVGQEGALSKVSGTESRFIFKSDGSNFPYTYVYAIWVDPDNTNHLLFGGAIKQGGEMNMYETYDEGRTITRFTDTFGFLKPDVREIISTDTYPAIIISDDEGTTVKLFLYKPA